MAFKNEDLAIHLSEQFEQDVWAEYARELMREHEGRNAWQREYAAQPANKKKQREYEARPDVRAKRYERYADYYSQTSEQQRARVAAWRKNNPERVAAQKRAWAAEKRASDPAYAEREKARHAARRAKKRAERLASQQATISVSP